MSTADPIAARQDVWEPKGNQWTIAVAVSLAAFMEVLDTSIANVSLPHIAGNLGASNDEGTWVLTSYLVSNTIVLPISGWLFGWLGGKRFFLTCIVFFTVSSFLCGIAASLGLFSYFESCRVLSEEACSRWLRPSWAIPLLPRSAAWLLLFACSALMFFSSFLLKKNAPGKAGNVSVH